MRRVVQAQPMRIQVSCPHVECSGQRIERGLQAEQLARIGSPLPTAWGRASPLAHRGSGASMMCATSAMNAVICASVTTAACCGHVQGSGPVQ